MFIPVLDELSGPKEAGADTNGLNRKECKEERAAFAGAGEAQQKSKYDEDSKHDRVTRIGQTAKERFPTKARDQRPVFKRIDAATK